MTLPFSVIMEKRATFPDAGASFLHDHDERLVAHRERESPQIGRTKQPSVGRPGWLDT